MPRTARRSRTSRSLLGAVVVAAALVGTVLTIPAAQAANPRVTVDLGTTTGAVMHGANGTLYGLSDDGVPGDELVAPLHMTTVIQKPQGGAQHPNGDALTVKTAYDRDGGGEVHIYMQDVYANWPYENNGLSDYLAKVDTMVSAVATRSDADDFVWVPFNEPDGNWYTGLGSSDSTTYANALARFKNDWTAVYDRIRSIIPGARIAGPNETHYDARLMGDFYPWAKANNVLPDITTWHELDPGSLSSFESTLAAYRKLETSAGIAKLPVSINEYGNRRDQSVPGQMIQWMSMFERNKVYADQAYWNIAGNLNDNAVQTNIPNGTWWLLRWYAGLSGQTVKLTPPQANTIDTVQGIASLDTRRKQAQVLLGGTSGSVDTVIQHVPSSFGKQVDVTVERTGWSGYEGAAAAPGVVSRTKAKVASDGSVTVPLTGLDAMSAYRVTLNPAGSGSPTAASLPWSASYEAENAAITSGTVYSQGSVSNPYGFATSGTKDVGSLNQSTSKVAFTVSVPTTGTYDLSVFYGNQSGGPATQTLTVDGGSAQTITYGPTLNWTYRATAGASVPLTAGTHTLTLAKGTNEVTLDKIDLTASTTPNSVYPAAYADVSGSPAYDYSASGISGAGALKLDKGDKAAFDVYAPADGYYTVHADYSSTGSSTLSLDGATAATLASTRGKLTDKPLRLYLSAGNNRITAAVQGAGCLTLRDLRVTGAVDTTGVTTYEAEAATLAGTAVVTSDTWASGGSYVGYIGNGPANILTVKVDAASAGRYVMNVRYANNQVAGSGNYNTNIVSRAAQISVNGTAQTVMFRNNYSWNNYWDLPVPVTLKAGTNTITFANSSAYAPNIDRITTAPLTG
ncbi:CBM35 domain-containing protein [Streptomyces turgidiscabies]|uniref:Carbohydrate binding module (Family 6) n=2 Tax=Streptomyces TaxID=1883 RepID=L7EWZ0_STRT8|nr:CBM35 domain-containing protein [Streptomyces turgidiscabies]ELP63206.1 carbohydrate binding module (family 6) [Streptomyces turgidiscabies Car8]MDX3499671.1 CBM35 domain-containing protein [Streptomyces turgidiscabies]GAQ73385.1 cycloisomaltooligosaccharide glucanotransferase [Streptomyces turgidiscabies]